MLYSYYIHQLNIRCLMYLSFL